MAAIALVAVVAASAAHLSGSLYRPASTPADFSPDWAAAILPSADSPSDNCFLPDVYTFDGGIWPWALFQSTIYGANASYTSLAGISYPAPSNPWHALPLVNGTPSAYCNTPPSYFSTANVVYLTGYLTVRAGFNGEIAVLPAANQPTHFLYMIASNARNRLGRRRSLRHRADRPGRHGVGLQPAERLRGPCQLSGLSFHIGS